MSKRGKFEDEWNSIFDEVQDQPSGKVWSEIKAEMAIMEADKQRNKVIYWRWFGVAASVVILLMVGIYGFNLFTNNSISNESKLAINNSGEENFNSSDIDMNSISSNQIDREIENIVDNSNSVLKGSALNSKIDIVSKENSAIDEVSTANVIGEDRGGESNKLAHEKIKNRINNFTVNEKSFSLPGNNNEKEKNTLPYLEEGSSKKAVLYTATIHEVEFLSIIDTVGTLAQLNTEIYLQKIPDLDELFKYNKKDKSNMWTGVSMGGGSFKPNVVMGGLENTLFASEDFSSGPSLYTNTTADIISNEATETAAFSYNLSVDFGKFITQRFFIESAVEYAKYSSEASSNLTSNTSQKTEAFLRNTNNYRFSYTSLQTTTKYQLLNSYEYLSVPLSFGYVVIDRKFGVLISSGVSADIFLNNTLQDQSGQYASTVQKNGEDSPYRPVNLNALFGGEIYYSWNENYVIGLNPGYRVSLSKITKQDANFNSRPTSLFVELKFKYLL